MPRDTAGNYTLPAGNPVASGEIIAASWANSTMNDLGQSLSASLDRYGRGGMLAPFQFTDGTESAPGATWSNEPTTGLYRNSYADLRMSITGSDKQRWTSNGSFLWRNNQWEQILTQTGGGGDVTIDNLVVTGSFTSPGIDDNATSTAITINAAEDVGIGTVSPDTRLHVSGANPRLRITDNNSTAATASTYLEFYGTDARSGVVYSDANGLNIQTDAAGPNSIRFLTTGNSEVMRVDSSGDVGLGTTTPDTLLHLKDSIPILTMEHAAGQSSRVYFEDATDGAWGGIRANYGTGGVTKEISLAPGNGAGDARFGGLSVTPTKATIGGDFQGTSLDVLGSIKATGDSRSVVVEDTGANGTKALLNTASTSAKVEVSRAGASASRATLTARGNSSDLEFENYQGRVATIDHGSTSEFSFTMDANVNARMTFNTGTAEAMRITQAGTVGIGLASPNSAAALHVAASSTNGLSGSGLLRVQNTQGNACSIAVYSLANDWTIGSGSAGDFSIYNVTANAVPFFVSTQAPNRGLSLEADSVDIKHNPATAGAGQLQISANANDVDGVLAFPLSGSSKGSIISNKPLSFHTGTTTNTTNERMRIDALGKVGIGTDAPQTKLHVTQAVDDSSDGIRLSRSNSAATYTHWVDTTAGYNIGYSNPATTDPTEPMFTLFAPTDSVGINTPLPQRSLHVNDVMRLEPRTGPPSSPSAGDIYFDTNSGQDGGVLRCYDGFAWQDCF